MKRNLQGKYVTISTVDEKAQALCHLQPKLLESVFVVFSFLVGIENHLNFPFECWEIVLRC